jgi:AcrR family transcriptional regulator
MMPMESSPKGEARPYHHGHLRQTLLDAADRLIESEGVHALSIRAVAREAGVSPAAPYHHFRDKDALLNAVAQEGWVRLDQALGEAWSVAAQPRDVMINLGLAYVNFARENTALYRLIYGAARNKDSLPEDLRPGGGGAYGKVREALILAGFDADDSLGLELAATAIWCSAHGLAEMAGFRQFASVRETCGGEARFLRAVFEHMGRGACHVAQEPLSPT